MTTHAHDDNEHYIWQPKLPEIKIDCPAPIRQALVESVVRYMGTCDCHPVVNPAGQPVGVHACDTHWFLRETDEPGRLVEWTTPQGPRQVSPGSLNTCVGRVDRLLFARSQRARWQAGEFGALLPRADNEELLGW